MLRSLKGHSGRINSIDVHPSGKVALSVGKDKTLKMWDLMRGRGAASLALGVGKLVPYVNPLIVAYSSIARNVEAEKVKFSADGKHFAILTPQGIDVYTTVRVNGNPSITRLTCLLAVANDEDRIDSISQAFA